MIPANCHPDKEHVAGGLCSQCYRRRRYETHKERDAQYNRNWRSENQEKYTKYQVEYSRQYRKDNASMLAENDRWRRIFHRYGLTQDEYEQMLEYQSNCCALCGYELYDEVIDHNHETGIVRGILHRSCNTLLGLANEDIELLSNAINYLSFHSD